MAQAVIGMLKIALVLGLVVAWGVVLLPPLLRFLSGFRHRASTFERFNGSMSRLGSSDSAVSSLPNFSIASTNYVSGADSSRPCSPAAKKRRRDILVGLMATTAVTLVASLAIGGKMWLLFVATGGLMGGYVYLLWSANQARLVAQNKITYLPQVRDAVLVEVPEERAHAVSR